ncbi:MAG: alpha-beta hydrolase superfamily lysophospholipase [Maribacter sp.]|jgi:alpha-beta hydrolase superfamily lysophospholipase
MEVVEKLKSRKSRTKRWIKGFLYFFILLFALVNFVAFMHAWKFTHFMPRVSEQASSSTNVSPAKLTKTLLLGISVPRPENEIKPERLFEEISLNNENGNIKGWIMEPDSVMGTVILSHGYKASMSKLLPYAKAILEMGYRTVLYDSTGSGDSEGNHCTIGYKEAKDLKTVFDYIKRTKSGDVYTLGTSMGAALTLRSVAEEGIRPKGIIIQCPFGSMEDAAKSRFRNMGVPFFGLGHLLVFWGGAQNGFNGFSYSPADYAKKVNIPTLHIWGAKDDRVMRHETDTIFNNLAGEKKLVILENGEHSGLVLSEPMKWKSSVREFLEKY